VRLDAHFLVAEPRERQLTLHYTDTGRNWGMKAWVGTLMGEFGLGWQGKRKLQLVEEKWPNGNLKTKGQTMNGEKYEEWQFFNEAGDRIRTINYSRGGSAECNPNHPSNKGAGKLR
jgi:antitoxin component YwqK of YwqJK toxin-antitoxin module